MGAPGLSCSLWTLRWGMCHISSLTGDQTQALLIGPPGMSLKVFLNVSKSNSRICSNYSKFWVKTTYASELFNDLFSNCLDFIWIFIYDKVLLLLCPTLCDPMDCSTPGFLGLHHLSELAQTHVHRVDDAIQPSRPLSSSSPAFNLSQSSGS